MPEFKEFESIPRLTRNMVVTEKIDGTNAQITIVDVGAGDAEPLALYQRDNLVLYAGSRNRFVTLDNDNFGFARWVYENREGLLDTLGPGSHFGEWWGAGIQRRYGLAEKRFSLFNSGRWKSSHNLTVETVKEDLGDLAGLEPTQCIAAPLCHVVPVLSIATFETPAIDAILDGLVTHGSYAAPGFMQPEGIVVYHVASRTLLKKTLDKNDGHKGV